MSDKHLGDSVHDLLDNRLSREATTDAMAHLESCEDCRTRWEELRDAREALKTADAGIDMRFTQQLLDRQRMAEIAQHESKAQVRAAAGQGQRPMLVMMLVFMLVSSGVVACYAAGAPHEVELAFADGAESGTADGGVSFISSSSMRTGDSLAAWAHPDWEEADLVPIEARVLKRADGSNILAAQVLAGSDLIVVTEQHGSLDGSIEDLPSVQLGKATAYQVGENPLHYIWQTGDIVISAACECSRSTLEAAASSFPSAEPPGFFARLGQGAQRIAATVAGD
ncbi:anti-sigma factor family protein [Demequina sediminicola]|uniref:anti-sigma factor family protein n=1 Tax=Demequina sediminicola TaxID=1095026 RepID=UPI000785C6E7|nr:zf-HC2 domain-containing protein [Demequina sediminicola]